MSAPLKLFNSLTRRVDDFVPIRSDQVRLYSCGPTVYNYAHLGNLRAYVFTDTLSRVLRWRGYDVRHVINITDVGHLTSDADAGEDKMEKAAQQRGATIWDIAAYYTAAFKRNLHDLNIADPTEWTVATDYVPQMIAFAERIAGDYCYELDSGLYFDTSKVADYGALAGGRDDAANARIDPVAGKRNPADFAIWRKSPPGETRQMEWDSPWGRGAPGWHLECSVMSEAVLGHPFDIHTGGIDHREIHHPNEIAQNQAHCGCTDSGARFWMHNNFLVDRTGKMSKSSGQFLTLQSVIDRGIHPLAYRLMCLQAHYRSEMEFTWEGLGAALVRLKRLVQAVERLRTAANPAVVATAEMPDQLAHALADDLATPRALAVMDEMLADKRRSPAVRLATLAVFDAVLGLNLSTLTRADLRLRPKGAAMTEDAIAGRIAERVEAKTARDFATADAIRAELAGHGVEIMDGDPLGWEWAIDLS